MARSNSALGKYRGSLGNLVFSVSRGKQIIRQKPEYVPNPRTYAQSITRNKFKLASQFTGLWDTLLVPYTRKKIADKLTARNKVFTQAFNAAILLSSEDSATDALTSVRINLQNFANTMNIALGYIDQEPAIEFTQLTQTATILDASAENPTSLLYQIVAFNKNGEVVGVNLESATVTSSTAQELTMPFIAGAGSAMRYDIIAYTVQPNPNLDEESYQRVTQMLGANPVDGNVTAYIYTLSSILQQNAEALINSRLAASSYEVS